ncbi:MAG: asparagine synthase (glutamine-hydrolyzing) [Rubrivivax sp.]|nr:asparagine synthase (glutamine-hydrolyzing) [Rubrivivax sp.]
MCGITGYWSNRDGSPTERVTAMTKALRHRGPDSDGLWTSPDGALALGHARLAIVDLSAQGAQPMTSRSGRYVTVFNGEIYNHLELRNDLAGAFAWRGHSDTETLLEGLERWGLTGTLQRAVGMFAIAVWDRDHDTLSLARDRMGEKPLHYSSGPSGLAFASEIKALRTCPNIDLALNEEAIRGFVQFGFIAGTQSVFRSITKVAPATVLTWKSPDAQPTATSYWAMPFPASGQAAQPAAAQDDAAQLDQLDALLRRSVRQQLLADVPLGAFLSGGLDSSLIVALMQEHSAQPVKTFSMGFGGGHGDELSQARATAQRLGTSHTELIVTPQDVLDVVPSLASIYDEPFADASQIPTVLLSRLTRQHVTVALSGDAGDELFGGYNRYLVAERFGHLLGSVPLGVRRALAGLLRALPARALDRLSTVRAQACGHRLPPALAEKVSRLAQFFEANDGRQAYLGMLSQWTQQGRVPLVGSAPVPELPMLADVPLAQRMMYWDMQAYLPDDILVKVDRAAMASSLETRVPFLDHRVIEFALATPMSNKIRNGESKWLLRRLLDRHLPDASFDGPKQGFTVPLADWLRGPLRDWAEQLLEPAALAATGFVDAAQVRRTWSEHLRGRNHQRGLWTILMLQTWLRELKK